MDLQLLATIGKRGVMLLICDSTNAEREGFTKSESVIGETLDRLIREYTKERIFIATFASNLHRMQQVFDTAKRYKRRVAALGRSMIQNIDIAATLGYLKFSPEMYISIEEAAQFPPSDLVILTTGSQGEPLSGLSRMANHTHPRVQIGSGDLVILSSSPIPGNETLVNNIINGLYRSGAKVIHQSNDDVHVSGHAGSEELKLILNIIKPKFVLPVHGEYRHQAAMQRIAANMGIPKENCYLPEIGDIIEVNGETMRKVGKVDSGMIFVDGLGVGDVGKKVLRERELLSHDGAVILVMTLHKRRKIISSGIEVLSRGFVYMRESEELIDEIKQICQSIVADCRQSGRFNASIICDQLNDALSSFLYDKTGRRPVVIPVITEI
jgi:ribonuclease J